VHGGRWTFAGDELKCSTGDRCRIAAGSTRLEVFNDCGHVFPGVYRIDGDTLVWTRRPVVFTLRRVRE
jgi:hypothetical protein